MQTPKVTICPYCGAVQSQGEQCRSCGGLFEPLSRRATQNDMGPWFVRDERRPFQPGCSYETIVRMIERAQITKTTVIRGPTTKQFWTIARRVPGIAHLLGYCHVCDASVTPDAFGCHSCGVPFGAYLDRNHLGLPSIQPLPWDPKLDGESQAPNQTPDSTEQTPQKSVAVSSLSPRAEDNADQLHASPNQQVQARSALFSAPLPAQSAYVPPVSQEAPVGQYVNTDHSVVSPLPNASSDVTLRALQRRFERQRRTIRFLSTIILAITIMALIGLIVVLTNSLVNSTSNGAIEPNTPEQTIEEVSSIVQPVEEGYTFESDYNRALDLIEQARQDDRAAPDRILDYQNALSILEYILEDVGPEQWPEKLEGQVQDVRRELDALQMKEYFP